MAHRPKLTLPRTPFERVLQVVAAVGLLGPWILGTSVWSRLPPIVPTHFGVGGSPDAWGSRSMLLFIPAVAVLSYLGLTFLERYPHTYNYPVEVTDRNAPKLYLLGRQLILGLKVIVILTCAFAFYGSVQVALGHLPGLGAWFLPAVLASVAALLTVMVVRMSRLRG